MCSLFLLLLAPAIVAAVPIAAPLITVLTSLVLLTSILSVLSHRQQLLWLCGLILPTLALEWVGHFSAIDSAAHFASRISFVVFLVYVTVLMLKDVMTQANVTANTLIRAVSIYLMIGIVWAVIYEAVEIVSDASFDALNASSPWGDFVYFSFTTMTTLGFGDITPVTPLARSMVMLEAVVGPLYLTILVARLVAMYRPTPRGGKSP